MLNPEPVPAHLLAGQHGAGGEEVHRSRAGVGGDDDDEFVKCSDFGPSVLYACVLST